jgi:hypothetical protein
MTFALAPSDNFGQGPQRKSVVVRGVIEAASADTVVFKPESSHPLRVVDIPTIKYYRLRHPFLQPLWVKKFEFIPFSYRNKGIRAVGATLSAGGPPVVTELYAWGPWVNGGAWVHTPVCRVDFLYRNIEQVQRTIADAHAGVVHHDFGQQPTFGFYSVIYLAETAACIPLHDPHGTIAQLKASCSTYPPRLKQRVLADSLWSAEFTLIIARRHAAAADVYNTVGCLTRLFASLTQALYALNERYFMSDKAAVKDLARFGRCPRDYVRRMTRLLAAPGESAAALSRSVELSYGLWSEVVALHDSYSPRFRL